MLVCDKLEEEFDCTGVWLLVEELPGDVEVAAAVVVVAGLTAAVDAAVVASAVFAAVASAAFAAVASAAFAAATCAANLRA